MGDEDTVALELLQLDADRLDALDVDALDEARAD